MEGGIVNIMAKENKLKKFNKKNINLKSKKTIVLLFIILLFISALIFTIPQISKQIAKRMKSEMLDYEIKKQ